MTFYNSLKGTMKVGVLHGSSNKLTFKLDKTWVFSQSNNLILEYFQFEGFLKG
jgi:hypothetical protein